MRLSWWSASLMCSLTALAACTVPDWKIDGRITRYTSIVRHQFAPSQLTVPANTPFWLAIDGYDESTRLIVSSPDLKIPRQTIRSHVHSSQWPESDAPQRTRLPVDALQPGRYRFTCECHGKPATLVIDAVPAAEPS